jgi:hypothetical protein
MNETKTAEISLEELSATPEWKSLGGHLKRLLLQALQSRNLVAAIHEFNPRLDTEIQQQLAENLLREPAVRRVIDLYALGIAVPLPLATQDKDLAAPSADAPVVEGEVPSDAEQVK